MYFNIKIFHQEPFYKVYFTGVLSLGNLPFNILFEANGDEYRGGEELSWYGLSGTCHFLGVDLLSGLRFLGSTFLND